MYGLRYSNQIDELPKREFAVLCVTILKLEVSHEVQQVSSQGCDGLRDAWLNGRNNRNGIDGKWIFQFKQYTSEISSARRRMIYDFKTELASVYNTYKDITGYIFITNVPHSGTKGRGSFDTISSTIESMGSLGRRVEFWDGQELCNLIDIHYSRVSHLLFPRNDEILLLPEVDPSFTNSAHITLNEESSISLAERLVGFVDNKLLSPDSKGYFGVLFYQGRFNIAETYVREALKQIRPYKERNANLYLSLLLMAAILNARMGRLSATKAILHQFRAENSSNRLLWGYYYDILSLVAEKENMYTLVDQCVNAGIQIYRDYDVSFNQSEWVLRRLHKEDWSKSGGDFSGYGHYIFRDSLKNAIPREKLSSEQRLYLNAMKSVYLALHYTWDKSEIDEANNQIIIASDYFHRKHYLPELARISSERGRITLSCDSVDYRSIEHLKNGLFYRIQTGELNRIRYDLLWLGQAYLRLGNEYYGFLLALVSRYIHIHVLCLNTNTDQGLLKQLDEIIRHKYNIDYFFALKSGDSLFHDLEHSTGVSIIYWMSLIQIDKLCYNDWSVN